MYCHLHFDMNNYAYEKHNFSQLKHNKEVKAKHRSYFLLVYYNKPELIPVSLL